MNRTGRDTLELIGQVEGLTLEFKSDLKCLADREMVTAVAAMSELETICSTVCSLSMNMPSEQKIFGA